MSNVSDLFTERLRKIDELLKVCKYENDNPVGFMNPNKVKVEGDLITPLQGNKRYRRYTFNYGVKVLLTIQTNAWYFERKNPLFESSVVSLLFMRNGEVTNPFIQDMSSTKEFQDDAMMLKDCLDMLIGQLDETSN